MTYDEALELSRRPIPRDQLLDVLDRLESLELRLTQRRKGR